MPAAVEGSKDDLPPTAATRMQRASKAGMDSVNNDSTECRFFCQTESSVQNYKLFDSSRLAKKKLTK